MNDYMEGKEEFRPPARRIPRRVEALDTQLETVVEQAMAEPAEPADKPPPPMSPANLSRNAFAVAQMVEDLQKSERQAQAEAANLRARLEQFSNRLVEMTAERDRAREQYDQERQQRLYLHSIMTNIGGLVSDALAAKDAP